MLNPIRKTPTNLHASRSTQAQVLPPRAKGMWPLLRVGLLLAIWTAGATSAQTDEVQQLKREVDMLRTALQDFRAENEALRQAVAAANPEKLATIETQIEALAGELERLRLGKTVAEADQSQYGLGQAASKVYRTEQGLSVGGYGEVLFESFDSELENGADASKDDQADALRGVIYLGYKFNDQWIFNSEVEFEHGSTSASGSASLEFATLDYLWKPELNFRAGLLLAPMGFVNELHEPPLFLSTERPNVERQIIPSTWRENGLGIFGDIGPFTYRTYLLNGLEAEGFSSSGLRGGRQKGSKAKANDIGWTGRLDYTAVPGLTAGISAYIGDSGQGLLDLEGEIIDARTEIYEAHIDWQLHGFRLRGLVADADVGDAGRLNQALGLSPSNSIADSLSGYYLELGYDLLNRRPGQLAVIPFVRYESLDTQADLAAEATPNPSRRSDIFTLGLAFKPIDQLVFKIDFQDWSNDAKTGLDQWNLALGYLF